MRYPEEELTTIFREVGIDFTASLPCEKIRGLLGMVEREFYHVSLTREEEGVGICAGAALAGRRPAMFLQSSGLGNMINALLSLTSFYELPLAIFASRRGVHQEKIEAQVPMGRKLPGILRGAGISCSVIDSLSDFPAVRRRLNTSFRQNRIHVFLLSPAVWEEGSCSVPSHPPQCPFSGTGAAPNQGEGSSPRLTRFEVLKLIAPLLKGKTVVCNLGFPSKELYHVHHQPSNFYMLGSMGMATPIGLGIALCADKEVVVIDGDGSILMNPGTLATAAHLTPANLTIMAVDNGAYGSTGNQPTLTGSCVDLEFLARAMGFRNTLKTGDGEVLMGALSSEETGPRFIHVLALPGNENVPNISLHHLENKREVMEFLREGRP